MKQQSRILPALRTIFQRPFHWLETRRWDLILPGIPAIVVAFAILIPTLFKPAFKKTTVSRYRNVAQAALDSEDYDQAATYLRKLVHLGQADDVVVKYNLALVDYQRGETEQAKAAIMDLAPADSEGYGPAHLWMAKAHLKDKTNWHVEETEILVHHLRTALKMDPGLTEAHLILGEIYLRTRDFPGAVEQFTAIADSKPMLYVTLGQLHKQLGDPMSSKQSFERAAAHLREKLVIDPANEDVRAKLALVYFRQDNFPIAQTILQEGLKRDPKSMKMRSTLSQLCLGESDRIASKYSPQDPKYGDSLTMLGKALQWAPNNVTALNRITRFIGVDGEVGKRAKSGLNKILANGRGTASIHLILGTNALVANDIETAETHLQLANELQPSMPTVLNNMAWMYMQSESPQLERAYKIADKAISLVEPNSPFAPTIYETRGQILVKLERYKEALSDLTRALPHMRQHTAIHEGLAKTYTALGQDELAEEHKAIAEELANGSQG